MNACPSCGRALSTAAKFCGGCGTKVLQQVPPATARPPAEVPPPLEQPPMRLVPPAGPPPGSPPAIGELHPPPGPPPGAKAAPEPASRPLLRLLLPGVLAATVIAGVFFLWRGLRPEAGDTDAEQNHGIFVSLESGKSIITVKVLTEDGRTVFEESASAASKSSDGWDPQNMDSLMTDARAPSITFTNKKGDVLLIDRFGKKTVNPPGLPMADFSEGLAAATERGSTSRKCGYLDRSHRMIVPAEFDECQPFAAGLAEVRQNGRYGYINRTGKTAIPVQYEMACQFHDGLALVTSNGVRMFIDTAGKEAFRLEGSGQCLFFDEGRLPIPKAGKIGYIDHSGQFAIPPRFDFAARFADRRAFVMENGHLKLIDLNGKEVPIPALTTAHAFEKRLVDCTQILRHSE